MGIRKRISGFVTRLGVIVAFILMSFILSVVTSNIGTLFGFAVVLFTAWAIRWDWSFFSIQKNPFLRTVLKAVLYTVLIIVVNDLAFQPFIEHYFGAADVSSFDWLKGNVVNYLFFLAFMWVFAAFGEEFLYRGYMTKQLALIFGDSKTGWILAILITSVIFGFAHTYQGPSGIITTGFVALIFGAIFYKNQNNLWVNVLTHGFYDVFGITLIFLDKYHISEWAKEHIYSFL